MGDVHRLKINTRTGVFELDGVSIMEQVLECTIHYRGDAPSVVEMTILADIDLEDCLHFRSGDIDRAKKMDLLYEIHVFTSLLSATFYHGGG